MKIKDIKRPITISWGTPEVTLRGFESESLIFRSQFRFFRHETIIIIAKADSQGNYRVMGFVDNFGIIRSPN